MPSAIEVDHQSSVGAVPSRDESSSELGSLGSLASLAAKRVAPNAFPGFVPALAGIKEDGEELVRIALRGELADPQERLEASGPAGAPFSYANAALFTQEQADKVVDDLKRTTRATNDKIKRFVSDAEWVSIDRALGEVGRYAQVYMSRATGGDTGLHLAITLGSLRAAQVFVEEGCDAATLNDRGVPAVDLLRDNFRKVMELVERIAQLEEDNQRRRTRSRRLTQEEQACLAQQERVIRKANEYRNFAHGMACYFEDRLSAMPLLEAEARACEIEGRDMNPVAVLELRLCEAMSRYRDLCKAIRDTEHSSLPELDATRLESNAERFTGVFTGLGDPTKLGLLNVGGRSMSALRAERTPHTAGVSANLASRLGGSMIFMAGLSDSSRSSPSPATASAVSTSADKTSRRLYGNTTNKDSAPLSQYCGGLGEGEGGGAYPLPVPYVGRSLISAEWGASSSSSSSLLSSSSKRVPGRMKSLGAPMTAGSWTASGDTGVPAGGGAERGGETKGRVKGGLSMSRGHGGSGSGSRESGRGKRGLARGYEGLYQIRQFETPE